MLLWWIFNVTVIQVQGTTNTISPWINSIGLKQGRKDGIFLMRWQDKEMLFNLNNKIKIKGKYLWCPDFNKEAAAFVRDFENFRPRESIDPQLVLVNHQATRANPQCYVNTIEVLQAQEQREQQLWHHVSALVKLTCTYTHLPLRGILSSSEEKSFTGHWV